MKTLSYRERVKKLEQRRLRAGKMFDEGKTQAEVAQYFTVTRAAACQWFAAWSADKKNGLASKGLSGPLPKLNPKQKRILKQKILSGPVKAGYKTDFWTLERIRLVAHKALHVDLGNDEHLADSDRSWVLGTETGTKSEGAERTSDCQLENEILSTIKKNGPRNIGFSWAFKMNPAYRTNLRFE